MIGEVHYIIKRHLDGKECKVFLGGPRVRADLGFRDFDYFPDLSVICDPEDNDPLTTKSPAILIEVLSKSSENKDLAEKYFVYQQIPSLREYLVLGQDPADRRAYLFRRGQSGWETAAILAGAGEIHLQSIDLRFTLDELFAFAK